MAEVPKKLDPKDFPINLPHHSSSWSRRKEALAKKVTNFSELDNLFRQLDPKSTTPLFLTDYYKPDKRQKPRELFFEKILPYIQNLVLKLPELFPNPVYHLVPQTDARILLTREQVSALLACSFFQIIARPDAVYNRVMSFNDVNFDVLFSANADMFPTATGCLCLLHYFNRIQEKAPEGNIIIHRKVLEKNDKPDWCNSKKPLLKMKVDHDVNIENDTESYFHADFANQYIGGGVLGGGCVQEEILFLIKPECLVSMLICPKMDENEAIIISGAERFTNFTGYAHSFRYAGDFVDETPRNDKLNIVRNHIIGIDAVVNAGGFEFQFRDSKLYRDINKAYCAFRDLKEDDGNIDDKLPIVSTGNWGCGAFGGDKKLKAIQQWLAASEADAEVNYHTFKDMPFTESLKKISSLLLAKGVTVGQLATGLTEFAKLVQKDAWENRDVFKYLMTYFKLDESDVDKLTNDIKKL
jgi:poly(ADP-ribose) glycohydrolase